VQELSDIKNFRDSCILNRVFTSKQFFVNVKVEVRKKLKTC